MNTSPDLDTLPEDHVLPPRPRGTRRKRSNTIPVSKADFKYMEERHFNGRFAILNRKWRFNTLSQRLSAVLHNKQYTIVLKITQMRLTTKSPDGETWRTVRLISAAKSHDGRFCEIEIKPLEQGELK